MLKEIKNIKSEKSDLYKFGITIGVILMVVAGILFWKEKESFQILLTVGVVMCILGFTMPLTLKPIYWIWMIVATVLGWIMTRVILSFLFYLILTPIGLLLRLFGKQFIELIWHRENSTYWNNRTGDLFTKETYEKQY